MFHSLPTYLKFAVPIVNSLLVVDLVGGTRDRTSGVSSYGLIGAACTYIFDNKRYSLNHSNEAIRPSLFQPFLQCKVVLVDAMLEQVFRHLHQV
jgi:hypothetical protein